MDHQTRMSITLPNKLIEQINDVRAQHLMNTDERLSCSKAISRICNEWLRSVYGEGAGQGPLSPADLTQGA
jgi:metal-responsive CopG/Arc/MetJ family transcriptional regulator